MRSTSGTMWKAVDARQIVRDGDGDEYWDTVAVWVPANVMSPHELHRARTTHRRWNAATWALGVLFVATAALAFGAPATPDWIALPPALLAILAGLCTQRAANKILHATPAPNT